jgi:hypothetical protein
VNLLRFVLVYFGVVLIVCASSVAAQLRQITRPEFDAVRERVFKILGEVPYRHRMTSDRVTETYEFLPPDRSRTIRVSRFNNATTIEEIITIGETKYIKRNSEGWEVAKQNVLRLGHLVSPSKSVMNYRILREADGGNPNLDIYEVETNTEYSDHEVRRYTTIERLWVDSKGLLVRREGKTINDNASADNLVTWLYEYPNDIQINTPIVRK